MLSDLCRQKASVREVEEKHCPRPPLESNFLQSWKFSDCSSSHSFVRNQERTLSQAGFDERWSLPAIMPFDSRRQGKAPLENR